MKQILAPAVMIAMLGFTSIQVQSMRGELADMRGELADMRGEMSDMRGEMSDFGERLVRVEVEVEQIGPLSVKVDDIDKRLIGVESRLTSVEGRLTDIEAREARRELLQELHRQLEIRFDESDEGVAYGGPGLAVDRLMLRAKPDVDAAFADILASPRSESPMLLTQDISNDLWERRMQFLERTGTALP